MDAGATLIKFPRWVRFPLPPPRAEVAESVDALALEASGMPSSRITSRAGSKPAFGTHNNILLHHGIMGQVLVDDTLIVYCSVPRYYIR
jgi:hypothetical protein